MTQFAEHLPHLHKERPGFYHISQVWWCTPAVLEVRRWRQEDKEAKVIPSCGKTKQKQMLANMQEARQNQLLSSCPFFAIILLLSWACRLSCPLWPSLADRRVQAERPAPHDRLGVFAFVWSVSIALEPCAVSLRVTSHHIGTVVYFTGVFFPGGAPYFENADKTVASLRVTRWLKFLLKIP